MKPLRNLMVGLAALILSGSAFADASQPHEFSYEFPVTYNPIGIAIDSEGNLWVSITDPVHRIEKYDEDGNILAQVGLPFTGTPLREYHFSQPRGIDVDSQDNVYVADFDPGRVQKYDSSGNFILMWGWGVDTGADQFEICYQDCQQRRAPSVPCADGDLPWPYGLQVDDLDRVWVRGDCNRVQVFDQNGNFLFSWSDGSTDIFSRGWLALDSASNVYIPHSGYIHKFDMSGTLLTQWPHTIESRGTAIEVDKVDNVYGVQNWSAGFWKYDDEGNFLVNFGSDANFDQPSDLVFGPDNTLYAVDRHHAQIKVFSPPYASLTCVGFEPPMADYPVKAKKNRSFPLKMQLFDAEGIEITDSGVTAAPLVEVMFTAAGGDDAIDVTDDLLSVGLGTEGNQFVYIAEDNMWKFNLKSANYTGPGTYAVTAVSGAPDEYVLDPACVTSFEVQ